MQLLVAGLVLATGCRQDMHNQPRYKALAGTEFFGDGRSARPPVEGTVARGHLRIDSARYTGKVNGEDVDVFPFPITRADLDRGRERFDIHCSPCHSRVGDGNGMIVRRGFRRAASYHTAKLMKAPVGHFFDVITNGFGAMPSYESRIEPDDRWRIAAYIRVLQYSQNATLEDVPADRREDVDKGEATPQPPAVPSLSTPEPAKPAAAKQEKTK
jgi:mono/diheme cytochrome c family protein